MGNTGRSGQNQVLVELSFFFSHQMDRSAARIHLDNLVDPKILGVRGAKSISQTLHVWNICLRRVVSGYDLRVRTIHQSAACPARLRCSRLIVVGSTVEILCGDLHQSQTTQFKPSFNSSVKGYNKTCKASIYTAHVQMNRMII